MSTIIRHARRGPSPILLVLPVALAALAFAGCERRERVVDIQTPAGNVQVDKVERMDNGADRVEVDVNEN